MTTTLHRSRQRIQCCPDGPNIMGGGLLLDGIVHSNRAVGEARVAFPRAATLTAAVHPRRRQIQCCPDRPNIVGGGLLLEVVVPRVAIWENVGLPSRVRRLDGDSASAPPTTTMLSTWAKHNGQWTPCGRYSQLELQSQRPRVAIASAATRRQPCTHAADESNVVQMGQM